MTHSEMKDRLMAKAPSTSDFDALIQEDTDFYDATDGRLVFRFRKNKIERASIEIARTSYLHIADIEPPSLSRASAAGDLDVSKLKAIRSDVVDFEQTSRGTGRLIVEDHLGNRRTLNSPMSNPVHSFLAGYGFARFTGKARTNRITSHFPIEWKHSIPFFQNIDRVHAELVPDIHKLHLERIKLHPKWVIEGTALSTCTINVNYESAYHYDVGDFKEGYSTLTVVEHGKYDGGFLVYPQYGAALDIREGDIIVNQSHMDMHGNTPLTPLTPGARRISFVTYLKHALGRAINRMDAPDGHASEWIGGRKLPASLAPRRDIMKQFAKHRRR